MGEPTNNISTYGRAFKASTLCRGKPSQLRFVYDKVSVNVRGLEALGVKPDQYGSLLIPVIMSKLPSEVRLQIARNSVKDVWEIKELLEIIRKEVEERELSEHIKADDEKKIRPQTRHPSTTSSLTAQGVNGRQAVPVKCAYCGKLHFSASCETVVPHNERMERLRRNNRCFVCLQVGHRANQCNPSKKWRRCGGRHHQSICEKTTNQNKERIQDGLPKEIEQQGPSTGTKKDQTTTGEQKATTATVRAKCKVFLQTATTFAYSKVDNALIPVRVLMDSGSQRSYVTESLKEKLDLVPEKMEVLNLNTFGDDKYSKKQCGRVRLQLQGKSKDIEISALCYPKICSPLLATIDLERHPHLRELDLADENLIDREFGDFASNIDVLIGADYYLDVITGEIQRGDGGPVAVKSEFGWLVSGSGYAKTSKGEETLAQLIVQKADSATWSDSVCRDENEGLTSAVRKFWETESLGIFESEPLPKKEFLRGPKFEEGQGRYQVSLPWKDDQLPTSNGYFSCLSRLRQLHSRLKTDKKLLEQYDQVIKEQEQSGIIEPVPGTSASDEFTYFLPHHGVVRQDKATTKVRVVFDGSAKHDGSNLSLNDCLEKGPNLVPHLFDIIIKFRGYPVGMVADVEKAFHQIEINPSDRKMLRFLWFDDIYKEHPNIVEYQFCGLVFGLTPSPAILTSIIQRHLELYKAKESEVVSLLRDSFYVDDFVGGAFDDDQSLEIHEKANNILKDGGFVLRKWHSNSKHVQTKVNKVSEQAEDKVSGTIKPLGSEQDAGKGDNLFLTENQTVAPEQYHDETKVTCCAKILGLNWNVTTDEITYDLSGLVNYAATLSPTKRSVLRLTAKVFDPLGLLTPFTVNLKVWFQTLRNKSVQWDDMLEGEALVAWNELLLDLTVLHDVRIPRCYFHRRDEKPISYQLHGFSDASAKAYAAVVYLRTVHSIGDIEINLVASKTRVAPLKKQSIPRLELLGATLLARLMNSVLEALSSLAMNPSVFYWTDSYTVLCWIRNEKTWKPYVNHRVQEIHKLTTKDAWRFCPGELNPADLPSRGCRGVDLTKNETWWNGPEFLGCRNESWPSEPNLTSSDVSIAFAEIAKPKTEPKITRSLVNVTDRTVDVEAIIDCKRYSNKTKLLRVTALVNRFIAKITKQKVPASVHLTAEELQVAEKLWVNAIQAKNFKEERNYLLGVLKKATLLTRQLDMFLDDEGIIRCQSRIEHSPLPEAAKQPILLPTRHHYTELVINDCHNTVHHNGVKETLNCIREVYWIPRGREAVKRVLGTCVICRRHDGQSYNTGKIATLPPSRVSDGPPFVNTGMDFAGPLYVKIDNEDGNERILEKAYVCLYTCASTRALHLELVPKLSVSAFLQSFRRFTARRGLPTKLLSDNAKTFKSAAKEVRAIARSNEVQRYFASKGIEWSFIVEKAPWQGGFWERMVKCVKRCLKKVVGRTSLSYEEMRTILIEIEATLNNRPMTYVYGDEDGISYPLTPAALIYGRNIATTPNARQFEVVSTIQSLTRRQKYHKRLLDQFTKQWRSEYLTSLMESSTPKGFFNKECKRDIKIGEIVVLKKDSSSRAFWNLARVEELIPSKDGVIRAAKVRVVNQENGKSSCLRRPIQHLVPLEVRSSYEQISDQRGKVAARQRRTCNRRRPRRGN